MEDEDDRRGSRRRRRRGGGRSMHVDADLDEQEEEQEGHEADEEEGDEEGPDDEELALLLSTFDRCRPRADGTVDARYARGRGGLYDAHPSPASCLISHHHYVCTKTARWCAGSGWRWAPPRSSAGWRRRAPRRASPAGKSTAVCAKSLCNEWCLT